METSQIRQRLHNYLEVADDKKIKALYAIMKDNINEASVEYTAEFTKELDKRYADYQAGKQQLVDADESKKRINALLKAGKRK